MTTEHNPMTEVDNILSEFESAGLISSENTDEVVTMGSAIPIGTAIIRTNPEMDVTIHDLKNELIKLRQLAKCREIKKDEDLTPLTEDLSIISGLKKSLTEKKRSYTDPIKEHLAKINGVFKELEEIITEADFTNRKKMRDYQEMQRKHQEEIEEINRQAVELARKQVELNQGVFTVDTTPIQAPVPVKRVTTDTGTAGTTGNWKFEIIDESLIPRNYLAIDMVKIGKAVRGSSGAVAIPGVRIYREENIRVSAR